MFFGDFNAGPATGRQFTRSPVEKQIARADACRLQRTTLGIEKLSTSVSPAYLPEDPAQDMRSGMRYRNEGLALGALWAAHRRKGLE
jgi:hypothetical protein